MKTSIFTLFFLFFHIINFSQNDDFEPNDGFEDAYNIMACNQLDLAINNTDLDFFNFYIPDDSPVDIAITNVSNSIIPKVTVYDNSYIELDSWTGNLGENLISTFTPPDPGEYFVKIEDIGNSTEYSSYNLFLSDYTCPLSSNTEILTFSIPFQIDSDIDSANDSIHVTMPYGTDVSELVADFTLSDYAGAVVGITNQVSGSTINDWTNNPVIFTITSQNGISREWSVYVETSETAQAEIIEFSIPGQISSSIVSENDSIHVTLPYGTNITELIAEFTLSYGAEVMVGTTLQISGSTSNDWTVNPIIYTVTAEGGSPVREWYVYIGITQADDNFEPNNSFDNASIISTCTQFDLTISNTDIDFYMLILDLPTEIALLNVSSSIMPKVTVYDISETELQTWTGGLGHNLINTFTPPSSGIYYIKIEDVGTNYLLASYNLILADASCPLSSEAEFLAYSIPNQIDSDIIPSNDSIHVTMPIGTDITELIAEFTLSDYADAMVESIQQISSSTPNDWTNNPVTYTVSSQNGTMRNWSVYIDIITGIKDNQNSNIEVYPNPSNGKFTIDLGKLSLKNVNIEIIDLHGNVIENYYNLPSDGIHSINLNSKESGLYFIKISYNNNVVTKKINILK